jgi:outer membrane protein OmpA-like peptidoglycan-associated protein
MRRSCVLILLFLPVVARAQPVSFDMKTDVKFGEKPAIRIQATQNVSTIRIELQRDDGKQFTTSQGALAIGASVILPIGDGAAGHATYTGSISAQAGAGAPWRHELRFETLVRSSLKVSYDFEHLDLERHTMSFKLPVPAASADLVVIGEDGNELGTGSAKYDKAAPDTWLAVPWTQPAGTRVLLMKLHAVAADGNEARVELIPWSIEIEHEDVTFATDSAVIERGEQAKLDASLAKIDEVAKRVERFVKLKLYVAGHTDTVGPDGKNRKLSLDRARAIAAYFRHQGFVAPIVVAGFGEAVLKVKTPDETDERANRRADYVLAPAGGAPPFKGPYLKAHAEWQEVK